MTTKVRNIIIENKEPEASIWSGVNYDSTYDFKLDLSDYPPVGWYTHCNIKVIDFKDKFSKVVENRSFKKFNIPDLGARFSVKNRLQLISPLKGAFILHNSILYLSMLFLLGFIAIWHFFFLQ